MLALYGLHRYHISKTIAAIHQRELIRREEIGKIRQILARDFHDEMGNKLAGITVLTSTLDLLITDKTKQVADTLQSLEETTKDLFSGTKSFIWSMDPESDHLNEIVAYIQHFAVDLLKNIQVDFAIDPPLSDANKGVRLSMGASRQIYFIMKEAITNAMVHAEATKLTLHYAVRHDKNSFELLLSDDGKGLSSERRFGKGLHNMQKRAEKIDAKLTYFNNPTKGFCVKLDGALPTL